MTQKERGSSMMLALLLSLSSPDLLIVVQMWVILNLTADNVHCRVCIKSTICRLKSLHLPVISEHFGQERTKLKKKWKVNALLLIVVVYKKQFVNSM